MSPPETRTSVADSLREAFLQAYGGPEPRLFFAPGRVNLVGAHLDYNGGSVLPMAVDCGIYVACRKREDGRIRLLSLDREGGVDIDVSEIGNTMNSEHGWASYPLGVHRFFEELTGKIGGVDMSFVGDLPIASGLSSSAAIEVATALALDALHGTGLDREDLARLAFRSETEYIGLRCGIMDQYASALGEQGQVLLLDCSGPSYEHVPLDPAVLEVLVMDTGVPRDLAGSLFNERVAECAAAHDILQQVRQRGCLAATTEADLVAVGHALQGAPRKRAEHVVGEVARVHTAVEALREGDIDTLGRMLNESHASTSHLFEVSCPELDAITAAARELPAVFGARLTGAGFGGCAIALIRPGTSEEVKAHVGRRYLEQFGRKPGFTLLREGAGAREL